MIRDFDIKDYPILKSYLSISNIDDKDMDILNVKTEILMHEDKIIGFISYDKVINSINLYHFYIEPKYRTKDLTFELADRVISSTIKQNCKGVLVHTRKNSDEDKFLHSYCRNRKINYSRLYFPIGDNNLYFLEV